MEEKTLAITADQITDTREEFVDFETMANETGLSLKAMTQAGWELGKTLNKLADTMPDEAFEAWFVGNISTNYKPAHGCMRLAELHPVKLPKSLVGTAKQLLIPFELEPETKETPRQDKNRRCVNFQAAVRIMEQWWRGGNVIKDLEVHQLETLAHDFEPMRTILDGINDAIDDHNRAANVREKEAQQ